MKLAINPLSQRDERWKLKRLGGSNVTIGNYGCLLVCHSMYLRYLGQDLLPDALNEVYKNKGVFDPQGNINFWAAATAFENTWVADEYYNCYDIPCDLSKIDYLLDKKMPVIALVDFSPKAGIQTHFVLIKGKENNSYLINDPWTGEEYFFEAKYGDPATKIFGLRIYTGREVPNGTSVEDQLSDCKVSLGSCEEALATKSLEVNNLRTSLETQERDNKDLIGQLLEARNQRDKAVREQEELAKKVEGLETGLSSAKEEIKRLKTALKSSQALKFEAIGTWDLAKELFKRFLHRRRG